MKPNEFWELFPKDIMIMNEGFQIKQQQEDSLHLETLHLLRYCAFITYSGIPTKKGHKKSHFLITRNLNDYLSVIFIPSMPPASATPLLLDFNSM